MLPTSLGFLVPISLYLTLHLLHTWNSSADPDCMKSFEGVDPDVIKPVQSRMFPRLFHIKTFLTAPPQ